MTSKTISAFYKKHLGVEINEFESTLDPETGKYLTEKDGKGLLFGLQAVNSKVENMWSLSFEFKSKLEAEGTFMDMEGNGFKLNLHCQPAAPVKKEAPVVWTDAYGDNQVIFCDQKTVQIISDPNKCGEARAKGSVGCTEMPVSFSGLLKAEQAGNLTRFLDKAGVVRHEAISNSDQTFSLRKAGSTKSLVLKLGKLDGGEDALKYYCNQ